MSQKSHRDPRAEHSRRVICRAALDEFADAGYAGFRMESVAARAGVGRSTLYRHWPDKAALIADALDTLNVQPNPGGDEPAATARRRVEVLLRHLAAALTDSAVSACVPALVHAAQSEPAVRDFFYEYSAHRRQRLTDTVAVGVAGGEFPGRVDPEAAATALSGALFYRRLATSDVADDDFVSRLVDTVLGR
ncbi:MULTISPECIES: TetR/AcrR family transcriptional regulator [unclassified Mycobacterium]|uniref:TetR/AcrR family transcriptional regulator n=1 Tax=unclassified Mycobacterium TaxID=2642494 RepID=UPI00073FF6F9|nr:MULTISPECIES: TetR/AcrR family transcriptional regulator [unclassified Mycobacterium]KUH88870.1 TetR family transcriptional regulator [Mycobacterium sp. GA-0227b]KUH91164.1 TetR family transcriptional regulator [Mycobacterium sp. GA-1999]KUH95516.1 TetR family transcriptional regulator [Mycobacterium sp. IS-1556]